MVYLWVTLPFLNLQYTDGTLALQSYFDCISLHSGHAPSWYMDKEINHTLLPSTSNCSSRLPRLLRLSGLLPIVFAGPDCGDVSSGVLSWKLDPVTPSFCAPSKTRLNSPAICSSLKRIANFSWTPSPSAKSSACQHQALPRDPGIGVSSRSGVI